MSGIERRSEPRTTIDWDLRAVVELPTGGKVGCRVVDLSENGARLKVIQHCILPDEFSLRLASRGVLRHCRVMWRMFDEIGVKTTLVQKAVPQRSS